MTSLIEQNEGMNRHFTSFLALFLIMAGLGLFGQFTYAADTSIGPDMSWQVGGIGSPAGTIDSFQVFPSNSQVGVSTSYSLSFKMSGHSYRSMSSGRFVFAFPPGFALSDVAAVSLNDGSEPPKYSISKVETSGKQVSLFMKKTGHGDDEDDDDGGGDDRCSDCPSIKVTIVLDGIGNPTVAANYQLAVVAFKSGYKIAAGPELSELFELVAGPAVSLSVLPERDTTLVAGEVILLEANAVDAYGNIVGSSDVLWTIANGTSIGQFFGSLFQATTVGEGRLMATVDGISKTTGLITVTPGDLRRMELNISANQVVGYPFVSSASITLYDAFSNLKTDYDLSTEPIIMVSNIGQVDGATISDNSLLSDGVVGLLPATVRYFGPSGVVEFYAMSGSIVSPIRSVNYSGYDILGAIGTDGQTIASVYSEARTSVSVPIRNAGALLPSSSPFVSAYYMSGGEAISESGPSNANGFVDSVHLSLPVNGSGFNGDTLILILTAEFTVAGQTMTTIDTALFPVVVTGGPTFEVVDRSMLPDSAYPGLPFDLSFDVLAVDFVDPIDSTLLTVFLADSPGGAGHTVIYQGRPDPADFVGSIISYKNLEALVDSTVQLAPGWYTFMLDYTLYSSSGAFGLAERYPDSIYLLPKIELSYISSTFGPDTVFLEAEASFNFDLFLDNDFPVQIYQPNATFTLSGPGFTVATDLLFDSDKLYPGINSVHTARMIVPSDQLGVDLDVNASISFVIPGSSENGTFKTNFDGETVFVDEKPLARIISVEALAPNSPVVNSSQPFQLRIQVSNESAMKIDSLRIQVSSDGQSTYDPIISAPSLMPGDTIDLLLDVIADAESNRLEQFSVSVASNDVGELPADDNQAAIIIETPASLVLGYELTGVGEGLVSRGGTFNLTIHLDNLGEAEVTEAAFILTTGGIDVGPGDSVIGTIFAGQHLSFPMTAPPYDTMIDFSFQLTELPIDLNSNTAATISETAFDFSIRVLDLRAELLIESEIIGSNIIQSGMRSLFAVHLTNTGTSSYADIQLSRLILSFSDPDYNPIDVRDLLVVGNSGFFENGHEISTASGGDDRLSLFFDNYVIAAGQTRTMIFMADIKPDLRTAFLIKLEAGDILAFFADGSFGGLTPEIGGDDDGLFTPDIPFVVVGPGISSSFLIESNPFNPLVESAHFRYVPAVDSRVVFRVFTLTGEEVFSHSMSSLAGVDTDLYWDGRNGSGNMVVNGVYVCTITVLNTGEEARIKVAVVK